MMESGKNFFKKVALTAAAVATFGTAAGKEAKTMDKIDTSNPTIGTEFKQMQNAALDLDTARTQFENEQERLLKLYAYDKVATEKVQSLGNFATNINLNIGSFVQKKLAEGMNLEDIQKAALENIKTNVNTADDYKTYMAIAEEFMKGGLPSEHPNVSLPSEHNSHQEMWIKTLEQLVAANVKTAAETNDYRVALAQHNENSKDGGATASVDAE